MIHFYNKFENIFIQYLIINFKLYLIKYDVVFSQPGAVVRPKGWAVRPLKRNMRWVQNVVRQFGLYLILAKEY